MTNKQKTLIRVSGELCNLLADLKVSLRAKSYSEVMERLPLDRNNCTCKEYTASRVPSDDALIFSYFKAKLEKTGNLLGGSGSGGSSSGDSGNDNATKSDASSGSRQVVVDAPELAAPVAP